MAPRSRKRSSKRKNRTPPRASKPGDSYQNAVASVAKSIAPSAHIEVGTWTDGPDGPRELDVELRPNGAGSAALVVIECKDWTRPIGIAFVDALDSKRRDIGASVAMICSNSGFTADALRKAARVGIPALAALIKGDNRIRVVVREQIYTRIVEFAYHEPTLHYPSLSNEEKAALTNVYTREFTYNGKSIEAWVAGKLLKIAGCATRSRSFFARFGFREPIQVDCRNLKLFVSKIDIRAAFSVQWMTQVAEIGASQGMYDYLRRVVVFGPGPYQYHVTVNSESWGQPVDIEDVPPRLLIPLDQRPNPKMSMIEMTLGMLKNMPQSDPKDAPDLDALIDSEEIVDEDPQQQKT
jgi:Restriction endonuclease